MYKNIRVKYLREQHKSQLYNCKEALNRFELTAFLVDNILQHEDWGGTEETSVRCDTQRGEETGQISHPY